MTETKEIEESPTFPFTPFLLTSLVKGGGRRHFVVDNMEGVNVEVLGNNQFVQSFTWTTHKASKEEIKTFLEGEEE